MSGDANKQSGYETFEHTADVGLAVRGQSLQDLFEQAAAGFIDLMLDAETVSPTRTINITARAEQPEELLVAWLEEILFAFDAEAFAPAAARVESLGQGEVRGQLSGEDFDPQRHEVRLAVKAVTFHDLAIRNVGGRYEVKIVFDV